VAADRSIVNMNASEIRTRITDLEKASKDNLPAERFIEILNSLRNEIKITEKLLRVGAMTDQSRFKALRTGHVHDAREVRGLKEQHH